ncbi:MAG: PadR family transcriptional regulator [Longimicrobiales bacterium]
MSTQGDDRLEILQGTLDVLVLNVLLAGEAHGQRIARAILEGSNGDLLVEHGSLYPALQRLEERGWIEGEWGTSENNRRARFYRLTSAGRRQVGVETDRWRRLVGAMANVMGLRPSEE